MALFYCWLSESSFQGRGIAWINFPICLIVAAPLLAALWLFRRKATERLELVNSFRAAQTTEKRWKELKR